MKLILTTVVASGLLANVAQACSCGEGDESGFLWQGLNTVPRNLAAFPWEGGEAHDRTSLPSKQDFHLERLRQGSAPQAVDFVLERADAIFPDRTIPDFLLDGASVRDGLLYFKGRNGKDEVWPRPVIAVLRPTATLLAGATYRLTYDRAPVVDMFGNNPRSRPPQILTFTVGKEDGPSAQAESASIEVGEQKIESLTVSTRKGSCATTISAASRKVRLKLPTQMEKWRQFLLYSTTVDGRGWRPSPSLCQQVPHGTSWVGPGLDLLYASCSGGKPADDLPEGTHTVELEAWLPGTTKIVRGKATLSLKCDRRPTSR